MPDLTKYKITIVQPNPLRFGQGEQALPGHRMAYRKRVDTLMAPGDKRVTYRARCTCKWEDDPWVTKRMLVMRYSHHINELDKQGRLV